MCANRLTVSLEASKHTQRGATESSMDMPSFTSAQRRRILCIGDSYRRLLGEPLVAPAPDPVEALWAAPLAIVAHGTEPDPVFFFGNRTALSLFEMDFAAFTQLPSRLSAEPLLREERARLLERVAREGFMTDYAGVRISSSGHRFRISSATVWNLADDAGHPAGQAAAFASWTPITA